MAASDTIPQAKAGTLRAKQWKIAYSGPEIKCCAVKFTKLADPLKEDGNPAIAIYIDGDQEANLAVSLNVDQSTQVCGKTIRLCGLLCGAQVAHWEMLDDQATEWFE